MESTRCGLANVAPSLSAVIPSRRYDEATRCVALMCLVLLAGLAAAQAAASSPHPIVLHAARMLDIKAGRIVKPAEILVQGDHIVEVGSTVKHPDGR